MRFRTTIKLAGKTATGIEVPAEVVECLAAGKRPAVRVTVSGHTYRSTIARRGETYLVGVSAENREQAAGRPRAALTRCPGVRRCLTLRQRRADEARTMPVVALLLVLGSAVWVGYDARTRDFSDHWCAKSTTQWVIGMLGLWIIAFPVYLYARDKVPPRGGTPTLPPSATPLAAGNAAPGSVAPPGQ